MKKIAYILITLFLFLFGISLGADMKPAVEIMQEQFDATEINKRLSELESKARTYDLVLDIKSCGNVHGWSERLMKLDGGWWVYDYPEALKEREDIMDKASVVQNYLKRWCEEAGRASKDCEYCEKFNIK